MKPMSKWQVALVNFMRGRYGFFDLLGKHLLYLAFALMFCNFFVRHGILSLLSFILIGIAYYRVFSKRIYVRTNENQRYQKWFYKVSAPFRKGVTKAKRSKDYRYYKCPNCRQEIRVPKNRGKLNITCPKCQTKFIKKT